MERNPHLSDLPERYLFGRVAQAKQALLAREPNIPLLSLGVGDTTLPLPVSIAAAMAEYSAELGTARGYSGYGPCEGWPELRKAVSERLYASSIDPDEVFISDGAKCDIGRLGMLIGPGKRAAIQDPTYPVYVDLSHILGHRVTLLPCNPDNGFFPNQFPNVDLLYLCSPNNPTGTAATRRQLEGVVEWAHRQGGLILFDAAYSAFIRDPSLPRSIYSIPGADEVAIELNSFSKLAGFTGVRLGWTIVPRKLRYRGGGSVHQDWNRLIHTVFNGPSNVAQAGGLACLGDAGWKAIGLQQDAYLSNAARLRTALLNADVAVYGGEHAPFLWVHVPGTRSWDLFEALLQEAHVITVPGSGFGACGEGYLRLSSFGSMAEITEAAERLSSLLPKLTARLVS